MLRSFDDLRAYGASATDGEIGKVRDLYFDQTTWSVRYLVVESPAVLGRRVLIAPAAVEEVDGITRTIRLALSSQRVRESPPIDTDQPVSRQMERRYFDHYGWPYYWGAAGAVGAAMPAFTPPQPSPPPERHAEGDPCLRSMVEVVGYTVEAADGTAGQVEDLVGDDEAWSVRYLVVSTRRFFGSKVLISPGWTDNIDWSARRVEIGLPLDTIKNGPAWDPRVPVNRRFEERLYDYYGRPVYWTAPEGAAR